MRLMHTDADLPVDDAEGPPVALPPRPERRRVSTSFLFMMIVLVGMVAAIFTLFPKRQNLLMSEAIAAHQAPPAWQLAAPPLGELKAWWLGMFGDKVKLPAIANGVVPLGLAHKTLHRRATAVARVRAAGSEVTLLMQRTPGMAPRHKERTVGELVAIEWAVGPWAYVAVGPGAAAATWRPLLGVPRRPELAP